VKMEAVHFSDIAACLPDYKELRLGEIVARESHPSLPLQLFFYFVFFLLCTIKG
jgi:hypothetical protein